MSLFFVYKYKVMRGNKIVIHNLSRINLTKKNNL